MLIFSLLAKQIFWSVAITVTPVFWTLVQSFGSQRSGLGSECTRRATAELRSHSAFGRHVRPAAGSRLGGRAAKVADLSRSLGWLVKCTRQDPGVLV